MLCARRRVYAGRARGSLEAEMPLLSDAEIEQRLAQAPQWRREGTEIVRDFERSDFADAVAFINRVAGVAEAANHHPDILVHGYKKVRLTLSTHSAGGLTDSDFKLARQIDEIG
jgi:4a-hydroxytetrahydrobiopterin dehydratase